MFLIKIKPRALRLSLHISHHLIDLRRNGLNLQILGRFCSEFNTVRKKIERDIQDCTNYRDQTAIASNIQKDLDKIIDDFGEKKSSPTKALIRTMELEKIMLRPTKLSQLSTYLELASKLIAGKKKTNRFEVFQKFTCEFYFNSPNIVKKLEENWGISR